MSAQLSEYELVRLENIKRNEEFLKSMGLYKDPNAPVPREDTLKPKKKPARKAVLAPLNEENLAPVRRSTRNTASSPGIKQEHASLSDLENDPDQQQRAKLKKKYDPQSAAAKYFEENLNAEDEEDEERRITPEQLRAFVDEVSPEHSELISNAAVQLCAYRCSYMSIAALKNRVRAVSTGGGKKSHEKLLVVTYAMKAMGLHRLAEVAAGLLKRNTGLVAAVGGSSGSGSGDVKEEGGLKEEGGSGEGGDGMDLGGDMKSEDVVSCSSSSNGHVNTGDTSVKVKLEAPDDSADNTTTSNTSTDPIDNTTTNAATNSPRGKGKRTRGKSTISSIVKVDGGYSIVYSGDGSGCVDSSSSASSAVIKTEPVGDILSLITSPTSITNMGDTANSITNSTTISTTDNTAENTITIPIVTTTAKTRSPRKRRSTTNYNTTTTEVESAFVSKKIQKIQQLMDVIQRQNTNEDL